MFLETHFLSCNGLHAENCFGNLLGKKSPRMALMENQGPPNGGVSNGGVSHLDSSFLFCPFLSFLGLSRFFRDFPDLLGDGSFLFSFSAYREHLRGTVPKGSATQSGPFPTKKPGLETPRFSFSQEKHLRYVCGPNFRICHAILRECLDVLKTLGRSAERGWV